MVDRSTSLNCICFSQIYLPLMIPASICIRRTKKTPFSPSAPHWSRTANYPPGMCNNFRNGERLICRSGAQVAGRRSGLRDGGAPPAIDLGVDRRRYARNSPALSFRKRRSDSLTRDGAIRGTRREVEIRGCVRTAVERG